MDTKVNLRELILDGLLSLEREDEHSHVVIRGILDKYDYLPGNEKAFVKRVMEGTIEHRLRLDYVLDSFSKVPVKKMKPLIRTLLRMSVYQILFMDAIPDSAVCNEAVRLASMHKFGSLKGFVNGVLRNIVRKKDQIAYPSKEKNPIGYFSVLYSMPTWIVTMWLDRYGFDTTERMLRSFLEEKPVTVRLCEKLSKEEVAAIEKEMTDAGILMEESDILPYVRLLRKTEGMHRIKAFADGLMTVQDVSSMLAVLAADIKKGDFVMDVCAAPGGKTFFAYSKVGAKGEVLARDVSSYKVMLLEGTKERLGAKQVTIEEWDATMPDESRFAKADVVLADVPCSGLGIIGKKQDIKYRMSLEGLSELQALQREILTTVQKYVKPGGTLLFSTCTIDMKENEENVKWFMENFPFRTDDLTPYLPAGKGKYHEALQREDLKKGYLQLLPGVHGTDGFFIARFVRE